MSSYYIAVDLYSLTHSMLIRCNLQVTNFPQYKQV